MVGFPCPCCGRSLTVPDQWAGQEYPCPDCGRLTRIESSRLSMTALEMLAAKIGAQAAAGKLAAIAPDTEGRTAIAQPGAPVPGMQPGIPGYEILGELGRGGMGVVYRARQLGLNRTVALKMVLAEGHAGPAALARFRAEAQTIARLQHPNIVQVYEVGEHDGRPYFSLELVQGGNLAENLAGTPLPAREAAELAERLARAIHAAHQAGIIHRDLKPSNVLLTRDGQPKITDFGLAKQADGQSDLTRTGAVLGTPSYMAPEQASGRTGEIGPAADTYALGATLYELLTGRPPFKGVSPMDTMLQVLNDEPVPPSRLNPKVPRDLETICLKCLHKEIGKRYGSAAELADDLQRFLQGEPIRARPVGRSERLWRWCRRNPAVAALAAALIVGVSVGFPFVTVRWREEATQRKLAEDNLARALAAEEDAKNAKKTAQDEAAVASAVTEFLQNDLLMEASPERNARTRNVTVEQLLDRAAKKIEGRFTNPLVEAAIRLTIGGAYYGLGQYGKAQPHLERALAICQQALGQNHPDTLEAMTRLGLLYNAQGERAKAEPLLAKALEGRRLVLGEQNRFTLNAMNNLAVLYVSQGRFAKAEPLLVQGLEVRRRMFGEKHQNTVGAMNNLAALYLNQGQYAKAEPLFCKTLEIAQAVFGEEHPNTLQAMKNLAALYQSQRRFAQAELLYGKALEARRRVLGGEHPDTLMAMFNLADLYRDQGQFAKAGPLLTKALEVSRRDLGEEHPSTLLFMVGLGKFYFQQRQFAKAEPLEAKVLEVRRRLLGQEHPDTLVSIHNVGLLYYWQKNYGKAEPLFLTAVKGNRRALGMKHPQTLLSLKNLVQLYDTWGKPAEAAKWRQELEDATKAAKKP